MMQIENEEKSGKGVFFVRDESEQVGKLEYSKSSAGKITVTHTEVAEKFRGEGIAQDLVAAVVDYARKNKLKIDPACPYAKKVIDETPEFKDILA